MDLVSLQALSRRAIFEWDDAALEGTVQRSLECHAPAALAAEVASVWLELMRGRALLVGARLPELFARVSASRDPSRVIEVTVLRALLALSTGQLGEALAFARRASLMARTEALPDAE